MLSLIRDFPVSIDEQWREAAPEAFPLSLPIRERPEQVPWITEFLFQLNNAVGDDDGRAAGEHYKLLLSAVAGLDDEGECRMLCHALTAKRRWQVVCCM